MSVPAGRFETLRFAKPPKDAASAKPTARHTGVLQDQLRRSARPPWCPSLSVAFRMIILVRVCAAMYSNISDCDEVYNFWEPLHYLDRGYGFQTWEVSPAYAIRSWAYISLHLLLARLPRLLKADKRVSFFALRISLAAICSFCEAKFYRTVADRINLRVGRYLLFFMLFSTGMWSASTAFLPSTFAMYTNMIAFSYAFQPPSRLDGRRTLLATLAFAVGALVGWPFALAIAIPFVLEEMFIYGKDKIKSEVWMAWITERWTRLIKSAAIASLVLVPVVAIDSLAYGKLTVVPWNIIKYNVLGDISRGPDLYGTSPWYFYILNLILNFNVIVPLALISLPALLITYNIDRRRLGVSKPGPDESSPFTVLAMRLAPLYVWLAIFVAQPHKEERFMFPVYPLICFNAAVTLYLVRGWLEVTYVKMTTSEYKASQSSLFRNVTSNIVILTSIISVSRIFALNHYYHAPLDIAFQFEYTELPRLLNATNLLPKPLPSPDAPRQRGRYDDTSDERIDLSPLKTFGGIRLCIGKEWHRFPSHYLIPDGINVDFIKSDFDGMLPGHFARSIGDGPVWKREKTREIPQGLNDLNREEPAHYVDVKTCDYLVDVDYPHRHSAGSPVSPHEPRYNLDTATWDTVTCSKFLDAENSGQLSRLFWLPGSWWANNGVGFNGGHKYGDYCLLRQRSLAEARESKKWT